MSETSKEMVENKDFAYNGTYKKEERISGIRGESECDFVLPDYMGDVKKLLKFSAEATPCSKFSGSDEVSFLGTVTYRVMYLDKDGILTEASFASEYEHAEKHGEEFVDADMVTKVQNLTVRLQGPRKICAKAALSHDVFMTEVQRDNCVGVTPDSERKERCVNIHRAKYFAESEREYAEELGSIEDVSADEVETVKSEARAVVESCKMSDEGIALSGYIAASALLRVDGELISMAKKIPFEEMLASEELLPENAVCFNDAYVTGCTINVNNERAADDASAAVIASVVVSTTVEFRARADYNCEHTLISDAFVKGFDSDNTYGVFSYNEMLGGTCDKKGFTAELSKKEAGAVGMHSITETDVSVKNVKCEAMEDGVSISCEVIFNVVAKCGGGTEFFSFKCPFEYNRTVKINTAGNDTRIRCYVSAENPSVTHDSETVYFSCDIRQSILTEKHAEENVLLRMNAKESNESNDRRVIVYYPEDGDTLWTVAKKYGVGLSDIIESNLLGDIYTNSEGVDYPLDQTAKILIIKP